MTKPLALLTRSAVLLAACTVLLGAHVASAALPTGAVAWWRAENNANDSISTNHGTLVNAATFAAGKVGQAFSFSGGYVTVPHSDELSFTNSFSISVWVNMPSSGFIVTKQPSAGLGNNYPGNYELRNNGVPELGIQHDGTHSFFSASSGIPANQWVHIAVVFTAGTNVQLFTNGLLAKTISTTVTTPATNTNPMLIGARADSLSANGLIDELSLFNRALTTAEVQGIYRTDNPFPEIAISGNGTGIAAGSTTPSKTDHTDFGSVVATGATGGTVTRTFTIGNNGGADLTLSGTPKVAVSGTDAADFTVTTQPTSPVTIGASTTFQVTFDPSALGLRTATLTIANDDSDEGTYTFAIQGTGTANLAPTLSFPPGTPASGALLAWGNNFGQLGDGTTVSRTSPVSVGSATNWQAVAAGANHSVAVKTDGTLWAWGGNESGQLGDGTTTLHNSPVQIGTATNWLSVAAGYTFTVALKRDGTLWAWGRNDLGQLGDGTTTQRFSPVQVGTATDWQTVAVGFAHTVAIKRDGTLWTWGRNDYGQLGDGTTVTRSNPAQVGTDNDWQMAAAGYLHTMALKEDGSLWGTGHNGHGALGDGTGADRSSLVRSGGQTYWRKAAAGGLFTLAIRQDGTLWACGRNDFGQLGDGTTSSKLNPVQVGVATNWLSVAAAGDTFDMHSAGVREDGTLWGWGLNNSGQVGDGTTVTRSSGPVQIGTATNWQSVVKGTYHTMALTLAAPAAPFAVTILQGASQQTVQLGGIRAGAGETQVLTVTATSSNPALIPNPTVTYTSPSVTGSLAFTTAANASGTAVITVVVTDDGGTANSGVNAVTNTFMVTVIPPNSPPSFALPAGTVGPAGLNWTARESSRAWYAMASSADGTKLAAGANNDFIYTSTDSGMTWTAQAGSGSRTWQCLASSADGTKLAATVENGQIYTSTDSGVTWTARESSRNWSAIATSADGTKLAATVDNGQIYTSTDSGVTWTARDISRRWRAIASSSDGSKLVAGVVEGQIYTSTDSGVSWTARESNRLWFNAASSADGTKLVAVVVNGGQIYTSTDSGVTWTARASSQVWVSVASSADGTRLAATAKNNFVYTSTDSGVTWTARDSTRGWWSIASSADGSKLVAGIENGQIYTSAGAVTPYDLSVLEDAGAQSLANFATNISAGPVGESAQTVSFTVTNNNNGLFSVQPAINAAGTLTFTSATNAIGTATVTVIAQDNGGTNNSGVDTSAAQTFTITVTAVNDAPTLAAIGISGTGGTISTAGIPTVSHTFTTGGTFVATRPVTVQVVALGGGGGGSGDAGAAGGGGGAVAKSITLNTGDTMTITVGAGGAGVTGSIGGNGGDTTVVVNGVTLVAGGGRGATGGTGGAGGVSSGGTVNLTGGPGSNSGSSRNGFDGTSSGGIGSAGGGAGFTDANTNYWVGGLGGGGLAGSGGSGAPQFPINSAGQPGSNYGGGGGGGGNYSGIGGAGAPGVASVSYTAESLSLSGLEDTPIIFTLAFFTNLFGDVDGNSLASITVATLPATGTLKLSGTAVTASQVIPAANLANLTYSPATNEVGAKTFTVTASDGSLSSAAATVTMTLTPVNDPPSFALPAGTPTSKALLSWGDNGGGQLGDGTTTQRSSPGNIGVAADWQAVAAALAHTAAIKRDGTLWTWGYNNFGQLGDGTTVNRSSPVQIGTASDWQSVAANGYHTVALKRDGTLWAWGLNSSGQLGDGTGTERHSPVQIGTASDWQSVACGVAHTMAIKRDGTLWAWGYNAYGQYGDGTTTQRASPVQIGTATDWQTVTAGYYDTLAIKRDGTLWAWGRNSSGQSGDGTTAQRLSPVQIGTATNWETVSTGDGHVLAVKQDGTLWAWGLNSSGQVGDGTTTQRLSPVQIETATNWLSAVAGAFGSHSVGVKQDGTLWAWGLNSSGQVGDGTTTQRPNPVQIGTATNWLSVAAGQAHTVALAVTAPAAPYNLTAVEDSGAFTTNGFANSISPGPADESAQTVSFTVTNNNNALFSVQPAINAAGTLSFTPAANSNGTATVTVIAQDNGGVANGGTNVSASQTFTITVTPVNDAPAFVVAANATGGIITTNGPYIIHTFTNVGSTTFTPLGAMNVEVLVVGGGGGAAGAGGGGGGGGVVYATNYAVSATGYQVTVGGGGAGKAGAGPAGTSGTNSSFDFLIAYGGGGGGPNNGAGLAGGSGGGAGRDTTAVGGSATQGTGGTAYGNVGGSGPGGFWGGGSGGGGAGAPGASGVRTGSPDGERGGAGGAGISNSISGVLTYYGGGGGGGNEGNSNVAPGGIGGGGSGGGANPAVEAISGAPNTGGGGGGSRNSGAVGSSRVDLQACKLEYSIVSPK